MDSVEETLFSISFAASSPFLASSSKPSCSLNMMMSNSMHKLASTPMRALLASVRSKNWMPASASAMREPITTNKSGATTVGSRSQATKATNCCAHLRGSWR